jgi:phosphoribosylaminoimidazole carboxylase PurE protein
MPFSEILMTKSRPRVAILLGSDSDLPQIDGGLKVLEEFGISYDLRIMSAHRTPDQVAAFVKAAEKEGYGVIIAAAGGAAHLAGVCAANTPLPVIGIPMESGPLKGHDALLATVQMPPGVPVATVSIGAWGAVNAAVLAARILSLAHPDLREKVRSYMANMADNITAKDAKARRSFKA